MKTLLSRFLLPVVFMAFIFGCATAPAVKEASTVENPAVITDIKLQGDNLSIVCSRNFVYTIYSSNDPYSVTVEIPDMRLGQFKNKMVFDNGSITEVVPQQTESPHPFVKLDLRLQAPSPVVPLYKDKTLILVVKHEEPAAPGDAKAEADAGKEAPVDVVEEDAAPSQDPAPEQKAEVKAPEETAPEKPAEAKTATMQKATEITAVELKKVDNTVEVLIKGNGAITPNVFPLDGRIVVDIPRVSMKATVPSAVISPLKGIREGRYKDKVRLVLDLREKTGYDVASQDDSVVISLKRKGLAEAPSGMASVKKTVKEESVAAQAAEENSPKEAGLREEPESREAKKPITSAPATETAMGRYAGKKISLDFQDADIGPIFRLLADVNGYNLVLDPSVRGKITIKLMNVPWDQALDIVLNTFNLSKQIQGNILWIAPTNVFSKILEEKAKEKEAAEKAETLAQEIIRVNYASAQDISGAITQGKLLSPRGSITIDARMNTLIVKDTPQSIERVKELVKIMDVSKPQVMIEAKLVQIGTSYSESLGITWGGTFSSQTWPTTSNGSFSVNTPSSGSSGTSAASGPGGAFNMTVGHANAFAVNLSLSALESLGKSKTLSNPKVLTMDNEAAMIQQGRTFYIATVSQAGTQTQQQQATLSLNVTPKITPDGYVQLKVQATDNSLEAALLGGSPQALVKNGETLVLGGIYTTDETITDTQVPLLGRIPGLGWLFKTRSQTGPNVQELLIFITPTIISQPGRDKL
jgi:type IV pilus assembly protein PilQ